MSEYWNNRYSTGGTSGGGSVGGFRNFIQEIVANLEIEQGKTILDYGCGDKKLWSGFLLRPYTGLDISDTIIERNKIKYPYDKYILPHELVEEYDVSLCISVVFHVLEIGALVDILMDLALHTNDTIIISYWKKETIGYYDTSYQRFWDIDDWKNILEDRGWQLSEIKPYEDDLNMVAIFRREEKCT